jgi:hypothetical protein
MFHIYYNSLGGSGQISPATIAVTEEKVKSVHTWQAAKKPLRPLYAAFRKVSSRRQLYVSESKNGKKIFEESSSNLKPKSTIKVGCLVTISIIFAFLETTSYSYRWFGIKRRFQDVSS